MSNQSRTLIIPEGDTLLSSASAPLLAQLRQIYDRSHIMIPFRPRGHWVVVDRDPEQTQTKGGLAIPEKHRTKTSRGKVLAIGNGCYENGRWITVSGIEVGDIVRWAESGGYDIEVDDKVYVFVPAANIILVENVGTVETGYKEAQNKTFAEAYGKDPNAIDDLR